MIGPIIRFDVRKRRFLLIGANPFVFMKCKWDGGNPMTAHMYSFMAGSMLPAFSMSMKKSAAGSIVLIAMITATNTWKCITVNSICIVYEKSFSKCSLNICPAVVFSHS